MRRRSLPVGRPGLGGHPWDSSEENRSTADQTAGPGGRAEPLKRSFETGALAAHVGSEETVVGVAPRP